MFPGQRMSIYNITGLNLSGIFVLRNASGPLAAVDFENTDGIPKKVETMSLGDIQVT